MVRARSCPELEWKNPSLPITKPACLSTCLAAAGFPVGDRVMLFTDGANRLLKFGRTSPLALVATGSRPASPWVLMAVRFRARLMALRTASWLVGQTFRLGK